MSGAVLISPLVCRSLGFKKIINAAIFCRSLARLPSPTSERDSFRGLDALEHFADFRKRFDTRHVFLFEQSAAVLSISSPNSFISSSEKKTEQLVAALADLPAHVGNGISLPNFLNASAHASACKSRNQRASRQYRK